MSLGVMIVVATLILLGIAGIWTHQRPMRILLCLLSIPPLATGVLTLVNGGIAEPFKTREMIIFCALTFWPSVGFTIGQVIIISRKRNEPSKPIAEAK